MGGCCARGRRPIMIDEDEASWKERERETLPQRGMTTPPNYFTRSPDDYTYESSSAPDRGIRHASY